jgi:hypothetical protein
MASDGVSLFFNLDFVATLSATELAGVLAREVMHPALQHHTRRGDRNPRRWNMAYDLAINPMLVNAGLTMSKEVLLDPRFRGMSAEHARHHRLVDRPPLCLAGALLFSRATFRPIFAALQTGAPRSGGAVASHPDFRHGSTA